MVCNYTLHSSHISTLIITILNDGCMLTIARDHVVPAGKPQAWDLPPLRAGGGR